MSTPRSPIRVEGRRLREIRISPAAAAIALALIVVAFLAWLASMLTGIGALAVLADVCGVVVMAIATRYTWRRLGGRGRLLFGLPAALLALAFGLAAFGLPGASVAAWAGGIALLVAIGFGVAGKPAAGATFGLARARVDESLLRSEAPAESLPVVLDERGIHFGADDADGSEVWRDEEIAAARLEGGGGRLVLRVTDRVGDEIAVDLAPGSRDAAEEIVEHLDARRR